MPKKHRGTGEMVPILRKKVCTPPWKSGPNTKSTFRLPTRMLMPTLLSTNVILIYTTPRPRHLELFHTVPQRNLPFQPFRRPKVSQQTKLDLWQICMGKMNLTYQFLPSPHSLASMPLHLSLSFRSSVLPCGVSTNIGTTACSLCSC